MRGQSQSYTAIIPPYDNHTGVRTFLSHLGLIAFAEFLPPSKRENMYFVQCNQDCRGLLGLKPHAEQLVRATNVGMR